MPNSFLVLLGVVLVVKVAIFGSLLWVTLTAPPPRGDGGPGEGGAGWPAAPPSMGGPRRGRRPPPAYVCIRSHRSGGPLKGAGPRPRRGAPALRQ